MLYKAEGCVTQSRVFALVLFNLLSHPIKAARFNYINLNKVLICLLLITSIMSEEKIIKHYYESIFQAYLNFCIHLKGENNLKD